MRRMAAGAWGLLLVGVAAAGAPDDGPELAAPADLLPPAAEAAPRPEAAAPPPSRPVMIRPRLRTAGPLPLAIPAPAAGADPAADLPPLIGPAEMTGAAPGARTPAGRGAAAGLAPRTLTLESVPREPMEFGPGPGAGTEPAIGGSAPQGKPRLLTGDTPIPPQSPGRRSRLWGRMPLPSSAQPPAAVGRGRSPSGDRDEVVIEPKSDPAADSALKRRVERQVREALGDKVREVEVLVVDRRVVVQARAVRFWQRRAVRRTIEGLPALAGLRATVHVAE